MLSLLSGITFYLRRHSTEFSSLFQQVLCGFTVQRSAAGPVSVLYLSVRVSFCFKSRQLSSMSSDWWLKSFKLCCSTYNCQCDVIVMITIKSGFQMKQITTVNAYCTYRWVQKLTRDPTSHMLEHYRSINLSSNGNFNCIFSPVVRWYRCFKSIANILSTNGGKSLINFLNIYKLYTCLLVCYYLLAEEGNESSFSVVMLISSCSLKLSAQDFLC